MMNIQSVLEKYSSKIDHLDLDLLIAAVIGKPREFVLTHPEYKINKAQSSKLKAQILRRKKHKPLAYILGQKEFYGLEFKVDKNTLIPRPETEQLVELTLDEISNFQFPISNLNIIDIGTGSGNIIISIAKTIENLKSQISNLKFIGIDISTKALTIAKQNAKKHKLNKKIKFFHGNLLEPIIKTTNHQLPTTNYIIIANLPYLSSKIYSQVSPIIKNYEPKSALLSNDNGLGHYKKLFKQIKEIKRNCFMFHVSCFMEISPEQKTQLKKAILTAFPKCYMTFFKDLAGKFRVVQIKL